MTKETEKQQKREQIAAAARDLFTEFGYRAVSVAQIAEQANVAKGTVYLYFKDKEELFLYLVQEFIDEMGRFVHEVEKQNLSIDEQFHTVIYNLLKYRREQKFLYRVVREAHEMHFALARRVTNILDSDITSYIEKLLEQAVRNGKVRPCNPKVLSFVIVHIYSALAFEWEEKHEPLDEGQVAEAVRNFLQHGLILPDGEKQPS
ncbi:TetR/AcrR family transcriptional regulator [Ethanoligenens harbinense]|uniref:Transcriptional regulator, TetR family n=1 Tax=Ethanoligenens harbinense (strain DSM 18485 / JCM 12961 / CGMCC 1.5033 / YUAN-3) TaxID=663278 RepID=E6U8B9_ETHHY|nr:TetR/AcrR family transcriptional regulator [Ethanoligenens harbinense]ADU28238.1 transcriptional regulator, TetR family [Ethanoligenens harbinense YUAN-3]AVQ97233.1 TetR/AcrR family transcriptional regulator [Ethanoligenens harbinense YUAN-3]AYF39898.1 TetR/AcrR family transcriptional regulator [Ethanoligenens harbinense]AYF42728.1 TetR/AcrR family transcriptional regulator [Ethanoligenens harbinense]QCN93478.1 TetR/AcrR family transcriptional regulator [Ethanoligenens harbinense]